VTGDVATRRFAERIVRRSASSATVGSRLNQVVLDRGLMVAEAIRSDLARDVGQLLTYACINRAGKGGVMPDEPTTSPSSPGVAYKFDGKRWSQTDRIVALATLVLFISMFLAWFGAGVLFFHVTVDGLWHGYMYITLIVCLAILGYLFLLAGLPTLPFKLPLSHPQVLTAATGLNFLLTLISFLTKPSGTSWQYGAYIGLIAAFVAFVPRVVPAIQARFATRKS
jgi:hypothetical protein